MSSRIPFLTFMLFALCAPPAAAQSAVEGSIRGYVKDPQGGVLPGATITASSPIVGGVRSTVSDAEGFYRLLNLPPAVYTITAELQGFSRYTRENVVVRAGLNLGVDILMSLGTIEQSVLVEAEAPMLDVTSPVQAVNIDGDFQRELPISTRKHWADFLGVTPGVSGIQVPGRSADSYMLRGSDFASHVIQLDGADMASAQQNATTYVNLSTEAIADVQVKTGAVDASAPLGVGAVINIATRSGSNRLAGSGSVVYQDVSWSGNNNPGGTSSAVDQVLPEFALGGPIMLDRAWFFGAYRYEHILSGISRTADQLSLLRALDPGFEPFDSKVTGHFWFTKGTVQLSQNHRLEGTYQYDPTDSAGGSSIEAGPFVSTITGGDLNLGFRLSSVWSPTLTTRFAASYNNKAFQIFAGRDVPSRPVHPGVFTSGGRLVGTGPAAVLDNGNAGWSFDQPYYKSTISGDLTWYKSGWGGGHEFQAGFYFQPKNHQETIQIFANGGASREEQVLIDPANPASGFIPFWREVYDVGQFTRALTDTRDLAFYIQDAWRPTSRLTINAGVRVDIIDRTDKLFDVTVQDSTDVGPRFGLNYMLTADNRDALRASWVRVHDVLSINPASAGTASAGKTDFYDLDLDGTFETAFVTPGATALATNRLIDLDRGQPYIDEWMLGYRRQFPGRLAVDASFIHREYRNRTALVEVNGIYQNGAFVGYQDERFNDIHQLTENEWNWHVYNGLEFRVTKDTERWQALAGVTRIWRHIDGTWQPNDPASFIQPDAFPNDKGIGSVRAATSVANDANSLSGTHMFFDNQAWPDYVARLGLVIRGPWELLFATNYSAQAGAYSGPVVDRIAAPDPRFGPSLVTLSNGRVVPNPLATTLRFAFDTRGDGQLQLSTLHIWNLRVGRGFSLPKGRVELAVDVFNVTNADTDQTWQFGANQRFSPSFALQSFRQLPRSARISARYAF